MNVRERARVSLCMMVRNEAHQLADCLLPVAELFDEIVIVDTGSTDATVEIARQFTPNVHHFEWCDDFSAARNESLRHASGNWIFWLDADDRVTPENVDRLKATLAGLPDRHTEYLMDTVCRQPIHSAPEPLISHPRLFSRHPDLRWQGRVHEQLRPCPTTLGFEVVFSDVQILHLGYGDAAVRQKKRRRDLRLLRMDYAVDPDDSSTLFHLGQNYAEMGQVEEARDFLLRLVALNQPLDCMRRVFATLCELAMGEGKFHEVLAIADRALAMFPGDPQIAYLMAEALYELDRYPAAKNLLVEIINQPQTLGYHAGTPNHLQSRLAPQSLAEVLRIQESFAAAEAVLRRLLKAFPNDTMGWHTLGRVYIDTGNRTNLEEVRVELEHCPEGHVFSMLLLAAWHLMRGDAAAADPAIDEVIATAPQMPMPRIMRAMRLEKQKAPAPAILQAFRDILRVQPGNAYALAGVAQIEADLRQRRSAPVYVPTSPPEWSTSAIVGYGY